jgi:hypothetical protein
LSNQPGGLTDVRANSEMQQPAPDLTVPYLAGLTQSMRIGYSSTLLRSLNIGRGIALMDDGRRRGSRADIATQSCVAEHGVT